MAASTSASTLSATEANAVRTGGGWSHRGLAWAERRSSWVLVVLLAIESVLLLYMGRGLTFFYDEWDFVQHDYGGGIHSLLQAHVGNISLFPVAVYKILFHLAGLNHYAVYRLVVLALHLVSCVLIFVLATRRTGKVQALLATALIIFLGAAWEDLLWPFQIGYMLSIVGGLGAWTLLDGRTRRATDVAAMLCLLLAVGSSSLGIAVIVGVAVELAWRREFRRGWIVLLPAALYGLWYLGYGESQVTESSLINAPGFAADLSAAAFGGLAGRGLDWGRPLAVAGVALLLYRLARALPVSPRLAGLVAAGIALWIVTAAARSTISSPEASRYVYLGAVVIVLTGVELLQGVALTPRAAGIATALVAFFAVTGLTVLHAGATGLRGTSRALTAELGALELAAAHAPPDYQPDSQRAPQLLAGSYLHTVRAIGSSPADPPSRISADDAGSQALADAVLMALYKPAPVPLARGTSVIGGSAPALAALSAGVQSAHGGCARLVPTSGTALTAQLSLPLSGVVLRDEGTAPVSLALRRFGPSFQPLQPVPADRSSWSLTLPRDASAAPWRLQLSTSSPVSVCEFAG